MIVEFEKLTGDRRIAACPVCGGPDGCGNGTCFHCGKCGFVECQYWSPVYSRKERKQMTKYWRKKYPAGPQKGEMNV